MNLKKFFFAFLGLTLALVLHDFRNLYSPSEMKAITPAQDVVDYYLNDFQLRSFQADGQLQSQMTGQHLQHWQGKQLSQINHPVLNQYTAETELNSTLQAEEALFNHTQNRLELIGDVKLLRTSQQDPATTLSTEYLQVDLNNNQMTTDRFVSVQSGANTLQGTGMDSKLNEAYLRLHANVKTTYKTKP